jgi:monomeric isocitrate dehydrogenase
MLRCVKLDVDIMPAAAGSRKTASAGRTTLKLDSDVAVEIKRIRKEHDAGLGEVVNDLLREAIHRRRKSRVVKKTVWTVPYDAGEPFIKNLDNVEEVLSVLEGDLRR